MEDETGAHPPSSHHQVRKIADPAAKLLATAERQFVYEVTVEQLCRILRAPAIVSMLVIRILWESPSRNGLRLRGYIVAVLSVESWRVTHAFGPGIAQLRLQTSCEALL